MEQPRNIWLFVILILLSAALFTLDRWGIFGFLKEGIESIVSPAMQKTHSAVFSSSLFVSSRLKALEEENTTLRQKLADENRLTKENEDLRKQTGVIGSFLFASSQKLLVAHILSTSRYFIIDKGSDDGVAVGNTVVYQNIFVGKIVTTGKNTSRVLLPQEKESVIQAKATQTGAHGIAVGVGNETVFSKIILSEKLADGDTVETIGDVDEKGLGIRPKLLLGKLTSVRKSSDQLFQEGKIEPLIDYKSLESVFVVL